MNKYLKMLLLLGLAAFAFQSCDTSQKTQQNVQTTTAQTNNSLTAWNKLMDDYHSIMSSTFHPAEEGNLAPLKENYMTLSDRAAVWSAAKLPAEHKGKGLEEQLSLLAKESKGVADMVKNKAGDKELTEAMVKLHDIFHGIVGACEGH